MRITGRFTLVFFISLIVFYLTATGCATFQLPGGGYKAVEGKVKSCLDTTIQVIHLNYTSGPKYTYFEDDLKKILIDNGYQVSDIAKPDLEMQIEYNESRATYREIGIFFLIPYYYPSNYTVKGIKVTFKTDKCSQGKIYRFVEWYNQEIAFKILSDIKKLEGKEDSNDKKSLY